MKKKGAFSVSISKKQSDEKPKFGRFHIQFPYLSDESPDALLITDHKFNIYYANKSWEQLTGYTFQEVKGKTPDFLVSKRTPTRVINQVRKALEEFKTIRTEEITYKRKNGSEFNSHAVYFSVKKNGNKIFYVQSLFDITQHIVLDKKLKESEERMRLIINNANGYAICMLDREGRVITWNPGAERLFGYIEKEVLGKSFLIFYPRSKKSESNFKKSLVATYKKGKYEVDAVRLRKDGGLFMANIVQCAIYYKNHRLKRIVVIIRDITKEKMLEQEKNAFIGVASHELKTPITVLSVYSQMLEKRLKKKLNSKEFYFLKNIKAQADRLNNLVDELLNISRIESGKLQLNLEECSLNELVKKVIVDFQYVTDTHVIKSVGEVTGKIYADKERIKEVVINLLSNAIKYSPSSDSVIVRLYNKDNDAVVSVKDFGVGISNINQKRIFKRFYRIEDTEKIAGFGLGLYISLGIIKRHKGKMWVESQKGKGSTFSFSLPLI